MKELPKIVLDFSRYLTVQLNRSQKTVEQYEQDLALFFTYIKVSREKRRFTDEDFENTKIEDIDLDFVKSISSDEIYEFFAYSVSNRGNSAKTRARKLSALKSFYKYLTVKTRKLSENPVKDWESPTVRNSLPKYLSTGESVSLLTAVQSDDTSKTRERDFAILTLFLNCGMRLSELVGINISNLDRELRFVRVLGKGSKERIIYLNDACRDALTAYLKARANDPEIKERDALFISSRHGRISNKTVQWVVYKYLDRAGLKYKNYSTHKLRHTAATLMYQSGKVDIRVLKDILGHEQLNTTQIYTHVSDKNMEDAVSANPLAHLSAKKLSHPAHDDEDDQ